MRYRIKKRPPVCDFMAISCETCGTGCPIEDILDYCYNADYRGNRPQFVTDIQNILQMDESKTQVKF